MNESDFTKPNVEFDAWVQTMPDTHWARYDLSACRLGWEAARRSVPCPRCGIAWITINAPSVISGNDEQGAASVTPTPVAASSLPPRTGGGND